MTRMMMIGAVAASLFTAGMAHADGPGQVPGIYGGGAGTRAVPVESYDHGPRRPGGWTLLGEVVAEGRRDRDIVHVGGRPMSRLMLVASDGAVRVHSLRVTFANGESQLLRVGSRFDEGTRSAAIDLPGRARRVMSVEVLARGRAGWRHGGGRLQIFGDPGLAGPSRPHDRAWVSLGATTLDGRRDADTLGVAAQQGLFRQLMLRVSHGTVSAVTVTFASGEVVTLPVQAGGAAVVDLPGNARALRAVTLHGGRGRAHVEILAS